MKTSNKIAPAGNPRQSCKSDNENEGQHLYNIANFSPCKSPLIDIALDFLRQGKSVIPLNGKKPAIPAWRQFQERLPTEREVVDWFSQHNNLNLAIVTGELSGLAVVDFDTPEAFAMAEEKGFPRGPLVKTGRGFHAYCQYAPGIRNFQKRPDLPDIDLRGEGGYVVAPGSTHETGAKYEWVKGRTLDDLQLPPIPNWILAQNPQDKQPVKDLLGGVPQGERNQAAARMAGAFCLYFKTFEEVRAQMVAWNQGCKPPLSEDEIIGVTKSIWKRHQQKAENLPQSVTDMRVAEHFANLYMGKIRWWPQPGKFLVFDGIRWTSDHDGGAFPYLKEFLWQMYEAARAIPDDSQRQKMLKGLVALEGHRRQETILSAVSVIPEMIINNDRLDKDPMLLNCRNGTLNLTTGELQAHNPENYITRLVNINYQEGGKCDVFLSFL